MATDSRPNGASLNSHQLSEMATTKILGWEPKVEGAVYITKDCEYAGPQNFNNPAHLPRLVYAILEHPTVSYYTTHQEPDLSYTCKIYRDHQVKATATRRHRADAIIEATLRCMGEVQ